MVDGGRSGPAGGNEACGFSADTLVATPSGERTIGSLKVGDLVEAYNPATGQTEAEPIQHVWINHDHNLVDVRVQSATGSGAKPRHAAAATGTAHAPTTASSTRPSTAGKGPTGWLRATLVAGLLGLALLGIAPPITPAASPAIAPTLAAQETVHTTPNTRGRRPTSAGAGGDAPRLTPAPRPVIPNPLPTSPATRRHHFPPAHLSPRRRVHAASILVLCGRALRR